MIVIPTPASASPAAMELGQRLVNVIEDFRRQRPGTSAEDVRQALRIAAAHSGARPVMLKLAIALLVGVVVAATLAFWMRMR